MNNKKWPSLECMLRSPQHMINQLAQDNPEAYRQHMIDLWNDENDAKGEAMSDDKGRRIVINDIMQKHQQWLTKHMRDDIESYARSVADFWEEENSVKEEGEPMNDMRYPRAYGTLVGFVKGIAGQLQHHDSGPIDGKAYAQRLFAAVAEAEAILDRAKNTEAHGNG